MAENAEIAFARTFLNTLSTQPITYGNDYQQPLENSLKRVQVLPVRLEAHRGLQQLCNSYLT